MTSPAVQQALHQSPRNSALPHGAQPFDACSDAPHTSGFIALLEAFRASGGTAPGVTVARLLEEHQGGHAVSLAKRIFTRELFGFDWRAHFWIPMFQFQADDLALKKQPQQVRAALPSDWSGWSVACWFAGPNIKLNGSRPVDVLEADFDAVLCAAELCGLNESSASSAHADQTALWAGAPVWRERRAIARV